MYICMHTWLLGDKGKCHENKKGSVGLKYTCPGKNKAYNQQFMILCKYLCISL